MLHGRIAIKEKHAPTAIPILPQSHIVGWPVFITTKYFNYLIINKIIQIHPLLNLPISLLIAQIGGL